MKQTPGDGLLEIIDEVTLILASITFLWGSISFYPGWLENVQLGDILFIVGSFVFLSKSLLGIRHSVKLHGWAHISTDMECFAEFFEHFCYVASSFVFTVGCVLFWPGLFGDNEEHIVLGEYIASLCFIVGSMGFVVASFSIQCCCQRWRRSKFFHLNWRKRAITWLAGGFFARSSGQFSLSLGLSCMSLATMRTAEVTPLSKESGST